jgi:colicin import membrane protein
MAPGRKRKSSAAQDTPAKKVRIGSATDIPDSASPAGRPKRTSVGTPQYNFTRRRLSAAQSVTPPTVKSDTAGKKRGRPAKNPAPAPTEVAKGRGRPPKTTIPPPTTGKGPGRPRKDAAESAAVNAEPKKRGRPPRNAAGKHDYCWKTWTLSD